MKERFKPTNNWNSFLPLLYAGLQNTSGLVVEFGIGDNSTPLLHEYCDLQKRTLLSFENNLEWWNKYKILESDFHKVNFVKDWDLINVKPSLLFIDHAPGERRKVDIVKYAHIAGIIVIHDSEPAADHGYQMRGTFKHFKFMQDYKTDGAWATILSNFVDVSTFEV